MRLICDANIGRNRVVLDFSFFLSAFLLSFSFSFNYQCLRVLKLLLGYVTPSGGNQCGRSVFHDGHNVGRCSGVDS